MKSLLYLLLAAVSPFAAVERQAESGDPEAIYRLSVIYERGFDSIPADTVRSIALLRQAADKGYAPAQNYLGFLYSRGEMVRQDSDSARYWIGRAADSGDAKAANNLAFILLQNNSEADDTLAVRYLTDAAEAGLPPALTTLGSLYAEGRAVPRDTIRAAGLFEKALEAGFRDAELHLLNLKGRDWMQMNASDRLDQSIKYWKMGSPLIGVELISGLMTDSLGPIPGLDPKQTARVYALLGHAYSHGEGVSYDHAKSNRYFAVSALMGEPGAAFIFSETLDIFPDAILKHLFTTQELDELRALGLDTEVTADDLRHTASEAGIYTARQARESLFRRETSAKNSPACGDSAKN